jgi:hypothetical protein
VIYEAPIRLSREALLPRIGALQPPGERVATHERDLAVGGDPVSGAQLPG